MAQSLDSLAEELTCSICLGLFNTPVTIPCGHNFCGECLELAWEACKLGEYRCPQCMCPFPSKPDLRKNTLLNNLVIQLQSLQLKPQEPEPVLLNVVKEDPCYSDGVLCDSCMALPAARTCLTCMASFCQEHLRPHLESPAFIHHLLKQPLRDLHARKCQEHEKLLDQYCREHLCCICCYCLANHKQCHTCTLQQGKMERKRDISNILQSLNQKIEKASNTAGELRREQKQVMDTVNKKKDLLEGEFEEIKALIEQEKMKSMRKIEEEEKKVNSKFGYTLSVLGKKKQEFEKMKSSVESLLLEEDDLQFLKRASKLHDTTSKEPYKPKMELDEKLLHQIFRNTVSLKDSIKAKLQQPDDTVEKMSTGGRHPKQDDTQEWKPSAASTERIPAGGRHPKQAETPNKNTFASTPTFPEVERHPKKGKPRATGPHVPSATAPDDKNKPLAKSKRGPSVPDSREDVLKCTIPDERESENIRNKGHCNSAPSSLSTRGCMPSGPGALFTFIVCNPLSTISCANHCVVGAEATVQLLGGTCPSGSPYCIHRRKELVKHICLFCIRCNHIVIITQWGHTLNLHLFTINILKKTFWG
uniref:RING-type domain-containing protein n=1 Tax=Xenopus tropicalis TaxID=8364 RepID=A0A803JE98_XENTR